jgi:hypothetical protein
MSRGSLTCSRCASALLVLWTCCSASGPRSSAPNFHVQAAYIPCGLGSDAAKIRAALLRLSLRGGSGIQSPNSHISNTSTTKGSGHTPDRSANTAPAVQQGSGPSWAERVKHGNTGAVGETGDISAKPANPGGQRGERTESSATRAKSLSPPRHGSHSPERTMDVLTSGMVQLDLNAKTEVQNADPATAMVS